MFLLCLFDLSNHKFAFIHTKCDRLVRRRWKCLPSTIRRLSAKKELSFPSCVTIIMSTSPCPSRTTLIHHLLPSRVIIDSAKHPHQHVKQYPSASFRLRGKSSSSQRGHFENGARIGRFCQARLVDWSSHSLSSYWTSWSHHSSGTVNCLQVSYDIILDT